MYKKLAACGYKLIFSVQSHSVKQGYFENTQAPEKVVIFAKSDQNSVVSKPVTSCHNLQFGQIIDTI